jgi:DmsE family decaheme c-type cytochrome
MLLYLSPVSGAMKASKAVFFMREARPVTRKIIGAAPGICTGLRVCLLLLLAVTVFCAAAHAAPGGAKNSGTKAPAAAPGDFVGSETCATCHEEVATKFANNKHAVLAQEHAKAGAGCESCHGAGKAHVDGGGDTSKIFNPAKAPAKDVTARCLTCHASAHPNFDRSPHAKAGVSCIGCHSVHMGNPNEHLLKARQPQLCFQCHIDVKPQFNMPFHHKVNEGAVTCNDCHAVHGSFGTANLKSTADQNAICTKCHTEKHGPFMFEHAPVKGDGCLSCHTPHGSQNARLLNAPNVNALCRQCHSSVVAGSMHSLNAAGSNDVTPCIDCHTMVHGSNLDRYLKR